MQVHIKYIPSIGDTVYAGCDFSYVNLYSKSTGTSDSSISKRVIVWPMGVGRKVTERGKREVSITGYP